MVVYNCCLRGTNMSAPDPDIETYLRPEVRVRSWRYGQLTTICRVEGRLIADLVLGRSADSRFLLEYLFETPHRVIDLRDASDPGIRPETVRHAAKYLAEWDRKEEGSITALLVETELGYGLGRVLQAHSSLSGSEVVVCRSVEEVAQLLDVDIDWCRHVGFVPASPLSRGSA